MKQKPYRLYRKTGCYVPTTQIGHREYYYKLLRSIEPQVDFDPNSTYGKHIMKETISNLRKYKKINQSYKEEQSSLVQLKKELPKLKEENKKKEPYLREKAINNSVEKIVCRKYPLIGFIKTKPLIISIIIAIASYLINGIFGISFLVFFVSYFFLSIIGNWVFEKLKKRNLSYVSTELKNKDFGKELREIEYMVQKNINQKQTNIQKLEKQIETTKSNIKIIIQNLLNEKKLKFILSEQFYISTDWKKVRDQAFATYEHICIRCGATENLSVDHVLPRSKFPERALDLNNTQILCRKCNSSKGSRIQNKNAGNKQLGKMAGKQLRLKGFR